MTKNRLIGSHEKPAEVNLFTDKAAVVLDWMLTIGLKLDHFSIREVARSTGISLGQVQKIVKALVDLGFVDQHGSSTKKIFKLVKPSELLNLWTSSYSLPRKCRWWSYEAGFDHPRDALELIRSKGLDKDVVLALHSAADAHGCNVTNLDRLELYVFDKEIRDQLEDALGLVQKERGYEILLISPYYKTLARRNLRSGVGATSPLLTYLDLHHFPLRGEEQAEALAGQNLATIWDRG